MPIYDVENRFSYYKSYSDNILVGPTRPTMGSYDWQRNVSGSVVSGSEEWRASTLLSDYGFKKANPFFRSGEVRYLRLSSGQQSIQDSYVPNVYDIFRTGSYGGGKFIWNWQGHGNSAPDEIGLPVSFDGKQILGSNGQRVNNIEWFHSFPYEKKYYEVQLGNEITNFEDTATFEYTSGSANIFSIYPKIFEVPSSDLSFIATTIKGGIYNLIYTEDYVGFVDGFGVFIAPAAVSDGIYNINKLNMYKFFYGLDTEFSTFANRPAVGLSFNYRVTGSSTLTIKGWKYGLYNGLPTNFSAVFRQNNYGQFRDMLEQRIYTKTYNNPLIGGPMDNNGGINFISGSALLGESNDYITASIYASDNVTEAYRVNPYGSGIFDKEYRASQPWYDNDPRVGT